MLLELAIENLVLVEKARIPFTSGLNIISGETGAGKSALLHALKLITGEKGDPSLIRHGEKRASIEAIFKLSKNSPLYPLLEKQEIEIEGDEITLRRELNDSGKSRAFIQDHFVSASFLKEITPFLIDITSQHLTTKLLDSSYHSALLDIFADLSPLTLEFSKNFEEEIRLKKLLNHLIEGETLRERDKENLEREIEEIEKADLKEGEEETLFTDYSKLISAEEREGKGGEVLKICQNFPITKVKLLLEELEKLDPSISNLREIFKSSLLDLEEARFELNRYLSQIVLSPERLHKVESRLKEITRLKKKYGDTIPSIHASLLSIKEKYDALQNIPLQIEELQEKIKSLNLINNEKASQLTLKREEGKKRLEEAIDSELKELNMAESRFIIDLIPIKRDRQGDEKAVFNLIPNAGGKKIAVSEWVSGGELNRILIAFKSILSDKEGIQTLVFDEIDANIGGTTAAKVGERLHKLGEKLQVISITHFVQVAKFAKHHLRVQKKEGSGRTTTLIDVLESEAREIELNRMIGV